MASNDPKDRLLGTLYKTNRPISPEYLKLFLDSTSGFISNLNLGENPLPKCLIGVEVEVEKVDGYINSSNYRWGWEVIQDGSLRNHGLEFKTHYGITSEIVEKALIDLFKDIPTAEFSARTSIHIHLDIRDLTVNQLTSLLYIYLLIEKLLYSFAGAKRYKNIFCVPLVDTNFHTFLAQSDSTFGHYLGNWTKYCGLNLLPISGFGTIEFRQLRGTSNIATIMKWIYIILMLKKYVMKNSFASIEKTIMSLNTTSTYRLFLAKIFRDKLLWFNNIDEKDLEEAVYFIKTSLYTSTISEDLKKEKDQLNMNFKQEKLEVSWEKEKNTTWKGKIVTTKEIIDYGPNTWYLRRVDANMREHYTEIPESFVKLVREKGQVQL